MKNYLLPEVFEDRVTVSFYHGGKYTPERAFLFGEEIRIRLRVPRRLGAVGVGLKIITDASRDVIVEEYGAWSGLWLSCDEYEISFPSDRIGVGLFFLAFFVDTPRDRIWGVRSGEDIVFKKEGSDGDLLQITVSDFIYEKPNRLYGGVIYHIFVDRFARGGDFPRREGGVLADFTDGIPEYPEYPGAPLKNNTFWGGTLLGIAERLDYIKSLGVNAIYLSPIFESPTNHKYDTADYMTVDSGFGGDEELKSLISLAKSRGMCIILDGVFNHTGSDSIYFNKYGRYNTLGAYQSRESPYFSWYDFKAYPDKYTCWWGIDILPRINPDDPSCRSYFVGEGGVIDKYRDMGIYGFRLDVVDELSDEFIAEIKARLSLGGESILYGEVWEDGSNKIAYGKRKRYYQGRELDGVMNYPLRRGIIDYITKKECEALKYALTEVIYNAPKRIRDAEMNLLGSHDTVRIITALAGESPDGHTNGYLAKKRMSVTERDIGRMRLISAYTVLATLPGIPAIYYGDEVGLEGYSDPFNRMPYPWGGEDTDILSHYREVGRLRRENAVYSDGDYRLLFLDPELLLFSRVRGDTVFLTAYNNSDFSKAVGFEYEAFSYFGKRRALEFTLKPGEAEVFISPQNNTVFIKNSI